MSRFGSRRLQILGRSKPRLPPISPHDYWHGPDMTTAVLPSSMHTSTICRVWFTSSTPLNPYPARFFPSQPESHASRRRHDQALEERFLLPGQLLFLLLGQLLALLLPLLLAWLSPPTPLRTGSLPPRRCPLQVRKPGPEMSFMLWLYAERHEPALALDSNNPSSKNSGRMS